MRHIVCSVPFTCSKCKQEHLGAACNLWELIICNDCWNLFKKELQPELDKKAREYLTDEKSCNHEWMHVPLGDIVDCRNCGEVKKLD